MTTVADEGTQTNPAETAGSDRGLGIFLTIAGSIAFYASTILTIDKIELMQAKIDGTEKALNCDLSAFVSCSAVVSSNQSEAFGFPNTLIGIASFAVIVTLGVLMAARVTMPRFVWAGLQVGVIFGIGFVTWLQYQAIFEIGKLCPWCMVVWAMMIPMFVLVTARATGWTFLKNWAGLISGLWIVAICAVIWFQFGSTLWA